MAIQAQMGDLVKMVKPSHPDTHTHTHTHTHNHCANLPMGLYVWWGLHRLWTLRCQKAERGMEVGTLSVVMPHHPAVNVYVIIFRTARAAKGV